MLHGTVQRHEATMTIASVVDEGTTFEISFSPFTESTRLEEEQEADIVLQPLNVLLAEDDAELRSIYAEILTEEGHTVGTAGSGSEALKLWGEQVFDLVITDRSMPFMSGDQLAQMIKEVSPETPVILVTGFGEIMQSIDENPPGIDHVLGKPVTVSQLRKAIATVMRTRQT